MEETKSVSRWSQLKTWLLEKNGEKKRPWLPVVELLLILYWTLFLGRNILHFSENFWLYGREFGMSIHPHYIWFNLLECGSCVFWNGLYNGGQPAFSELHAGILHPVVIVPTLLFGGINGAKIILLSSLAMAGFAQWWLARVMGLGFIARMWAAAMAITAGHLVGRLEMGVISVILSTAACSLVIPPGLKLALHGKRRDAIWLAITLALAIVAGQGYMQIGLLLCIFPAFLVFFIDDQFQLRPVWKEFLLAGFLALLLAGIFIVPMAHFWPETAKALDPTFDSAQPTAFVPFNFVIDDEDFYRLEHLGRQPYPYLYMNFIGWIPILLAFVPFFLTKPRDRKLLLFFWIGIFAIIFASSATLFRFLLPIAPNFIAGIRNPSLIQGLAVPLILGLAAWGVEQILRENWPLRNLAPSRNPRNVKATVGLTTIFVFCLLAVALQATYQFAAPRLVLLHTEKPSVFSVVFDLRTDDSQWVALPFGEHYWSPFAAEANLKLTNHWRPSEWDYHEPPPPVAEAFHIQPTNPNGLRPRGKLIAQHEDVQIVTHEEHTYAAIIGPHGETPCTAVANGGHIDVTCNSSEEGILRVYENKWRGWRVWQDGESVPLLQSQWLSTLAPAGEHTYRFRYQPWDVWLGITLSLLGVVLVLFLWVRAPTERPPNEFEG